MYQEPVDYGKGLLMTLKTCMGIVAVGDAVGALKGICRDLEQVLLQYDKLLWKSVVRKPIVWANFAAKIQSAVIFKDAMTHLVGKWKLIPTNAREEIADAVKKVLMKKLLDFKRKKQAIEIRMLGHYPKHLRKGSEQEKIKRGASGNPARSAYANDIYGWMALSHFRQWFSQVVSGGQNQHAKDGGYRLYRALYEGGNAYLTEGDLEKFYEYFPMSDKAKGVMENHIVLFKEDMRQFVTPLFKNHTHYIGPETLSYLLSADIDDGDCPWLSISFAEVDEDISMQDVFPDEDHDLMILDVPVSLGTTTPLVSSKNGRGTVNGAPIPKIVTPGSGANTAFQKGQDHQRARVTALSSSAERANGTMSNKAMLSVESDFDSGDSLVRGKPIVVAESDEGKEAPAIKTRVSGHRKAQTSSGQAVSNKDPNNVLRSPSGDGGPARTSSAHAANGNRSASLGAKEPAALHGDHSYQAFSANTEHGLKNGHWPNAVQTISKIPCDTLSPAVILAQHTVGSAECTSNKIRRASSA